MTRDTMRILGCVAAAAILISCDIWASTHIPHEIMQQQNGLDSSQDARMRAIVMQEIKAHPKEVMAVITQELQAEQAARNTITSPDLLSAIHQGKGPSAGDPAGVPVSVFIDLNCPYCRKFGQEMDVLLQRDPHVHVHIIDLAILTPGSRTAAMAELALDRANPTDAWALYQRLEHATTPLDGNAVRAIADELHLTPAPEDPADAMLLATNTELASQVHLEGTPVVVIGNHIERGASSEDAVEQMVQAIRGQVSQNTHP